MLEIAIIGAGPYGLSIGAHFRQRGIPFRIFGRPMDSWLNHMPAGMHLKSDGFASNIHHPLGEFTLKEFCAGQGVEYADTESPVRLETFSAYGLAFRERMLPELEDKVLLNLERLDEGFLLHLDSGETVRARRVVLAVGITHFQHIPETLAELPKDVVSHSFSHPDPSKWNDQEVVVIGAGASAIGLAALLHEAGAHVQLVARQSALKFHSMPTGKPRSRWERIRHPRSGLGPGLRSRFFCDAPMLFRHLPASVRHEVVQRTLGPSAAWFLRDRMANVSCLLGYTAKGAQVCDGKVRLQLRSVDGNQRELLADHIIAATGYKVNLSRLPFLSARLCSEIETFMGSPVLSSSFESSVPGIYFAGLAAADTFGPLMRFAFGGDFTARRLTKTFVKQLARTSVTYPVRSVATSTK
jgi:cation diffusion facilitator CzcD-associated flavoprotein CzcO